MPAPKGNQFWKLRSKHGRDKLFESPELLWEASCEYFEWCDENPLIEQKPFHSQGQITMADVPHMRPYTLEGLCGYLGCDTGYFRAFKSQERKDSKDFITVITQIEEVIFNQQYSGASSDFLNANLVARYLNISDKQEIQQSSTNYNVELSKEEIQQINKELESDF